MKKLVDLYCGVDDFCNVFIPQWQKQLLENGTRMTMREIMTIVISFHMSHYRDFKNYYLGYTRFIEVMPRSISPMGAYFSLLKGKPTGIEFID